MIDTFDKLKNEHGMIYFQLVAGFTLLYVIRLIFQSMPVFFYLICTQKDPDKTFDRRSTLLHLRRKTSITKIGDKINSHNLG